MGGVWYPFICQFEMCECIEEKRKYKHKVLIKTSDFFFTRTHHHRKTFLPPFHHRNNNRNNNRHNFITKYSLHNLKV